MFSTLNTAASGLRQFQDQIAVIGNNLANVNTPGFKGSRLDFADTLSLVLDNGAVVSQVGTGVGTAAVQEDFNQGVLSSTGYSTDLAVNGAGFFVVRDAGSGAQYVTRAGDFHLDNANHLVTNNGLRVQGYNDTGLGALGDLTIDSSGAASAVTSFSVGADGKITVVLADGTTLVRGQVLLQDFRNPEGLVKDGDNLFSDTGAAGALAAPAAPQTSGLGTIQSGSLEMSNVDMTGEFSTLITAQRAFEANARIITTTDQMLQDTLNLKT